MAGDGTAPIEDPQDPQDPHEEGPSADALAGTSVLDSVMPVLLFLVLYRTTNLGWAIVGATAWSVKTAISRRRRGLRIGWLVPLIVLALVVRGIISVVTDSEAVYVGTGIAGKFAIAAGLAGSVLIGRAAVGELAPLLFPFPRAVREHEIYRTTMAHLTFGAAAFYVVSGALDIWIYNYNTIEGYMVIRLLVGWPFGMVSFIAGFLYAQRRLNRVPGFIGMQALLEEMAERQRRAKGA